MSSINLFDMNPRQSVKVKDVDNDEDIKKPILKATIWDDVYRIYLLIGILYYFADSFIKMYEMKFPEDYLNMCKMAFFIHHIFTIMTFKSIFIIDHYPWFIIFPTAYHTLMVVFPQFVLNNPIYLTSAALWMYKNFTYPFGKRKHYKALFFYSIILMIPIAMLWWKNC